MPGYSCSAPGGASVGTHFPSMPRIRGVPQRLHLLRKSIPSCLMRPEARECPKVEHKNFMISTGCVRNFSYIFVSATDSKFCAMRHLQLEPVFRT
jgi:hypothetical protein